MYVEVFGGGLSVLYAKEKPQTGRYREVVNDINADLINLHRQIQKRPESLSFYLNQLLISRHIFNAIVKNKYHPRNDIEKAAYYFYLLSQSFGSKGKHFAMSAKSGRTPKNIYKSFQVYANRLKLVTIEQLPFTDLITKYDQKETLFYLDPPYVGTESYYSNTNGFGTKEHLELATILKSIKGKFILSYNDTKYIRELYQSFKTKEIQTSYTLNGKARNNKAQEVLICNF